MLESRATRLMLGSSVMFLLLDAVLAWALASFFTEPYESKVTTFLVILAAIYLASFALWARASIWTWLIFQFWTRKKMAENVAAAFISADIPKPVGPVYSAKGYFQELIENENLTCDMRVFAGIVLGGLQYPMNSGRIQEGLRTSMVYDDALLMTQLRHR